MRQALLRQEGFRAEEPEPWMVSRTVPPDVPKLPGGERACTETFFYCEHVNGDSSTWQVRVRPSDDPQQTWGKGREWIPVIDPALTELVGTPPSVGVILHLVFYRALNTNLAAAVDDAGPDRLKAFVYVDQARMLQQERIADRERERRAIAEQNEANEKRIFDNAKLHQDRHGEYETWLKQFVLLRAWLVCYYWVMSVLTTLPKLKPDERFASYKQMKLSYELVENDELEKFKPQALPPQLTEQPIPWADPVLASSIILNAERAFLAYARSMHSLQWGNNVQRSQKLAAAGAGLVVPTVMVSAVDGAEGVRRRPSGPTRGTWKPGRT